ncbi:HlyD family secretion protein [Anaerotignum propionicum]|uniref:HlyD family secretion protein n=1 Tax=Anaerotignum propionicum DSM 1682 TaxID=991789 RepID=A0A0X8VAQ4_ANAPI|nr:efflux RND transporter periplasmic adaptor subunit [Anaerotignum propionicum]AMJ40550.1 putative multidrug resistance protein EmrK [Anaerotignum propionicum DSM 1682]SHE39158.1 HlyD family secretion protein [[Clostridium] propionicum DSM 1682] [Anaerotignum propionicum DSM 1682]
MQNKNKVLLALVLAGCFFTSGCTAAKADATVVEEKPNVVTGTVECKEVYIRAKIPGYLTNIPVVEGQEISKGDLLFSSDQRDILVKQTQATGTLNAAKAVMEKAQANVSLLETEYAKYQELFELEAVAEDTMDKLKTQLEAAKLDVQAATSQYQAAQGVISEVNLNLSQTAQYAPCNGTVTMVSSSVGELVGSGTTIVTLTDYDDRWINANVDEYEVGKLAIGQTVPLTSKTYPDKVFHGKIVNVSKNPDFAIKKSTNELNDQDVITYKVKIALSGEDDIMLYPGMLVSVNLDEVGEAQ